MKAEKLYNQPDEDEEETVDGEDDGGGLPPDPTHPKPPKSQGE